LNGKYNWRVELSQYYRGGGDLVVLEKLAIVMIVIVVKLIPVIEVVKLIPVIEGVKASTPISLPFKLKHVFLYLILNRLCQIFGL